MFFSYLGYNFKINLMPKPKTNPILYNDALQISITKLKELGYLKKLQIKSGILNWSRNGSPAGSITISLNTIAVQPYIELDYNFRNEPRNYKIKLVTTPSNLNKGEIYYFLCPITNKRSRKLYSIGGYFLHREAFKGCMYESQTMSHSDRQNKFIIENAFGIDFIYEEIHKKHFKKTYSGNYTKRYKKLLAKINNAENVSFKKMIDILKK